MDSYDFIIVGAGSAGCVLANRLSTDKKHKVLLIEAGGSENHLNIRIPLNIPFIQGTEMDWRYQTVPQAHCNMRRFQWPRGRVLGGCSSINYMLYVRGHESDFNSWSELGNKGWAYKDVLPYFKKSENNTQFHDKYHEQGGTYCVSEIPWKHPLSQNFINACKESGLDEVKDFNGAKQEGCGYFQVNQKNGERESTATGFLNPARSRENLKVLTHTIVTRLIMQKNRVLGVEFIENGKSGEAKANKEVILSGGAINSPQILMLSGIGPAQDLTKVGVNPVVDLPGVGKNLQDHLRGNLVFDIRQPTSMFGIDPKFMANEMKLWEEKRTGMFTGIGAEAGAFLSTQSGLPASDLQLIFLPFSLNESLHDMFLSNRHGVSFIICPTRPKSLGQIKLASSDPHDQPIIDPNYLSSKDDIHTLVKGIRFVRELVKKKSFSGLISGEIGASKNALTDIELENYCRNIGTQSIYHPVGTCKMGHDPLAVVSDQLKVHDILGLRIVDASIIPKMVTGNINASIVMIAEKAADMILE